MTPEQFCYWLQGRAELDPTPPTEEQWKSIIEHLATVFVKVTPPLGAPAPQPSKPIFPDDYKPIFPDTHKKWPNTLPPEWPYTPTPTWPNTWPPTITCDTSGGVTGSASDVDNIKSISIC